MSPFAITRVLLLVGVVVLASSVQAFAPQPPLSSTKTTRSSSQLHLGIPSFFLPKNEDENAEAENKPEKKIGLSGVLQLITSGAGAPFLGEFEGVDKETGKFMFSLEANNLVDENGNSKQTSMPHFENGWVDPEDEAKEGFKFPWQK